MGVTIRKARSPHGQACKPNQLRRQGTEGRAEAAALAGALRELLVRAGKKAKWRLAAAAVTAMKAPAGRPVARLWAAATRYSTKVRLASQARIRLVPNAATTVSPAAKIDSKAALSTATHAAASRPSRSPWLQTAAARKALMRTLTLTAKPCAAMA
jgi:hypothetical protein